MQTVLISGANGYFGGIACDYFRGRGWKVLTATRQPGHDVFFDLDQPERFASSKLTDPVDLFIHAAASHEVTCAQKPFSAVARNVAGSLAALDFATSNKIPRFAYVSTFHVFGSARGRLDEQAEPHPENVYGLTHLHAEHCVDAYRRRGSLLGFSVRPANFYGMPVTLASFNRWSLTPFSFTREALELGEIVLRTSGFQRRNFVPVRATCELIERTALSADPPVLLHSVGAETLSVRDLAALVADMVQREHHRAVRVTIPDGEDRETPFEFCSMFAQPPPVQTMAEFVSRLARELTARPVAHTCPQ